MRGPYTYRDNHYRHTVNAFPETHPKPAAELVPDAYRPLKYEMEDLYRHAPKIFLQVKMGKKISQYHFAFLEGIGEGKWSTATWGLASTNSTFSESIYKLYEPYLPGITKMDIARILNKFRAKQLNRAGKMETPGRLYPMSKNEYHEFANKAWARRGRPNFGKRTIDGIQWGNPETVTHGRTGKIHSRYLGAGILDNKFVVNIAR